MSKKYTNRRFDKNKKANRTKCPICLFIECLKLI